MREIKFRAWNGKEMIEPYSVKNGKAMIIKECDKNDPVLTDEKGVNYYCNWDIDVATDYPLMQYTGLKDCDGVEIYEGDITKDKDISQSLYDTGKYVYGVIEFIDGRYADVYRYDGEEYHEEIHNVVVIGNIHQNPELIK